MKTKAFLTRIIPMLGNVRESGIFNKAVASMAQGLGDELARASESDLVGVADLAGAIGALAAAQTFETQQAAIAETLEQADGLLDAIANGTIDRIAPKPVDAAQIVSRILVAAGGMRDVFAPKAGVAHAIRADAAELSSLVDADIIAKVRTADAATDAAMLFEGADRLEEDDFRERAAAVETVITYATRLAA